MEKSTDAVIETGNGGQAFAADLSLKGFPVQQSVSSVLSFLFILVPRLADLLAYPDIL